MKKYRWVGWTAGGGLIAAAVALFLLHYFNPAKGVYQKTDTFNLVILDSGDSIIPMMVLKMGSGLH